MKILLLTRFLSAGMGGSEYVGTIIAELLAKNGHQVWVITNKMEGIKTLEHENIHPIFVSLKKQSLEGMSLKKTETLRYNLSAIRAGLSIIKKEKIDIIHSNQNFGTFAALAGAILSILTRTPHIKIFHHFVSVKEFEPRFQKKQGPKWKATLFHKVEKFSVKLHCSAVHAVSEATKDALIKLGETKPIFVIPNAISIPNIRESKNVNQFQFVSISRMEEYKMLDVIIKAVKTVKESYPEIKLILIGDGPYRKNLEKLASKLDITENVVFMGYVSNQEKESIISSSLALVFPSVQEGFGLVILEAFAQKKPVLVSDVRPMSDIVENNKTGLVISPLDENKWASGMIHMIQNQEKAVAMGQEGRSVLEEKYSLSTMWENLSKMYKEVIQ